MYIVKLDGQPMFDPRVDELKVSDLKLNLEVNTAGTFNFTIYPSHPLYDNINKLKSVIEVYQDNILLFRGRPLNDQLDFYNVKKVICEGDLAFLNDSIQRPYEYSGTVSDYLEQLIVNHNAEVAEDRQFTLGNVTVIDANDYITRADSSYPKTWETIKTKLLDLLGGYIMVRRQDGINYIDYLADSEYMSEQVIRIGENILDVSRSREGQDIYTAIIPIGATLKDEEGNDYKLDIKSVNGGLDYIYDQTAVDLYGWIFRRVEFNDVAVASNLLTKAQAELAAAINTVVSIDLKAIDLSLMNPTETFNLTNLVTNGDFSNGTTGWAFNAPALALTVNGGIANLIRQNTSGATVYPNINTNITGITGHKYYTCIKILNNVNTFNVSAFIQFGTQIALYYNLLNGFRSATFTANNNATKFYLNHTIPNNNTVNYNADDIMLIDLTQTFGAGNEPTKAEMDLLMDKLGWFNGTIETTIDGVIPFDEFRIFEKVKVESTIHLLDEYYLIKKLSLDLTNPRNNSLSIGRTYKSFTERQYDAENVIRNISKDYVKNEAVQDIKSEIQTVSSNITQEADNIRLQVAEGYTAKTEFSQYKSEVGTEFSQVSDAFSFQFNQLMTAINSLDTDTQVQFTEIIKYIRFIDGNIVLGQINNPYIVNISNTKVSFLQDNVEVAYISNNKLYVFNGEFINSLKIGNFGFTPRANGNLSFGKVV